MHTEPAAKEWNVSDVGSIRADEDKGRVEIRLDRLPVSAQSRGTIKQPYMSCIRSLTRLVPFLITGDAKLEIQWFGPMRERYESDSPPDVDNILKPILDALSGPDGVIVNDCQFQRVESTWFPGDRSHFLNVSVISNDTFVCPRNYLVFVGFTNILFYPFDDSLPPQANECLVDWVSWMTMNRHDLLLKGMNFKHLSFTMPEQRSFHKSRVQGFQCKSASDYRNYLIARQDYHNIEEVTAQELAKLRQGLNGYRHR